jgi:hypothetical protein
MAKGARGPEKRPRRTPGFLRSPGGDHANRRLGRFQSHGRAPIVIGSKTPVRPHQRQEHRLYRGIPDGARHHISRKCGWLATRRQRSSTHSIRCGVATPISFSTGGIGPTYGDITADCVAKHSVCRSIAIRARSLSCTNSEDDRRRDILSVWILSWCRGRRPQLICGARP